MDHKTALSQAIAITDDILELLDEGDFESVGRIEGQRKQLIEQAFMTSIEEIDVIRAQHLQRLNQQAVDKLNQFRKSIIQQQAQIRAASRATRAYRAVDSDPIKSTAV